MGNVCSRVACVIQGVCCEKLLESFQSYVGNLSVFRAVCRFYAESRDLKVSWHFDIAHIFDGCSFELSSMTILNYFILKAVFGPSPARLEKVRYLF